MPAPIVIFAFNRPLHTELILNNVFNFNSEKSREFFIFVDGPRNLSDAKAVEDVIKIASSFSNLKLIKRNKNLGTSKNITQGIEEIFKAYEEIIVLEDDILISEDFINFMDYNLSNFSNVNEVGSIQGYSPKLENLKSNHYFLLGADCWGWATWKRSWNLYCDDGLVHLKALLKAGKRKEFDLGNSFPYTSMLQGEILGFVNSWAIKWHASMFLNNKFALHPNPSLITNIGFDGTGVNSPRLNNNIQPPIHHINKQDYVFENIGVNENDEVMKMIIKHNSLNYDYNPIFEFLYRSKCNSIIMAKELAKYIKQL